MSSWNFQDLTGQRFGKLTVLRKQSTTKDGQAVWVCVCDCGSIKLVRAGNLKSGDTVSCGCHKYELLRKKATKHGESKNRIYRIWWDMIHRCEYPGSNRYSYYGERGISVCDSWRSSFENFRDWALSSGYNDDLSIDRINIDGNYCPENCRWATNVQQANNRRNAKRIMYRGEEHTLAEWSRILGFPYKLVHQRITRDGKSFEEAIRVEAN